MKKQINVLAKLYHLLSIHTNYQSVFILLGKGKQDKISEQITNIFSSIKIMLVRTILLKMVIGRNISTQLLANRSQIFSTNIFSTIKDCG
jgi:uncharacterized membrane protein